MALDIKREKEKIVIMEAGIVCLLVFYVYVCYEREREFGLRESEGE